MASGAGYAASAPAQPADRPLGMATHRSMTPDHGSMMSPRQMRRHMRSQRMREMHGAMMGGAERRGGMGMEGVPHRPRHR